MNRCRMGKRKGVCLFLIFILILPILTACSEDYGSPDLSAADAYWMVIDQLYQEDSGLNGDIKYLAIDTTEMVNLTEEGKEALLKQLESYGYEVLDTTFQELQEQGLIHDLYFPEGILFQIQDEPMEGNTITMDASKWRSGTGAIGYDNLVVEYKNDIWEIKEFGGAWIS
ncbi:hypothetical protein [Sinanaerobacter chloroacetimidivorans]|jgi:hypothetical protein|uniref:Uncharacterized protein n=1 Tax=Sinanaerobacter chloroacetimidivorans TaxID=2818044 RepID=A0A8J7VZ64_9FIRM|nr:hypothetical protein [Sinanaerobacter chloroacetimidivorans]MBR0597409.1 hypothetical protein [Sinanaerobacter chloroacetimidivorans]